MLFVIGVLSGFIISFIGSFLISLIPWIPFGPVFLTTVIPSILVFLFLTIRTEPDASKFKKWINGFISIFVIGFVILLIRNFFQSKAIDNLEGNGLNWDAVILFNVLYSLGAALLISPIAYLVIKRIAQLKKQYLLIK